MVGLKFNPHTHVPKFKGLNPPNYSVGIMSSLDIEINQIAEEVLAVIEQASSKELESSSEITEILHLIDVRDAKKVLQNIDKVSNQPERADVGKRALIKALLLTTWLHRLYFVIRAFIMGILSAVPPFIFLLVFGSINLPLGIALGIVSFVFALVVSRLFDSQLVRITRRIIGFLANHRSLRSFILKHL